MLLSNKQAYCFARVKEKPIPYFLAFNTPHLNKHL